MRCVSTTRMTMVEGATHIEPTGATVVAAAIATNAGATQITVAITTAKATSLVTAATTPTAGIEIATARIPALAKLILNAARPAMKMAELAAAVGGGTGTPTSGGVVEADAKTLEATVRIAVAVAVAVAAGAAIAAGNVVTPRAEGKAQTQAEALAGAGLAQARRPRVRGSLPLLPVAGRRWHECSWLGRRSVGYPSDGGDAAQEMPSSPLARRNVGQWASKVASPSQRRDMQRLLGSLEGHQAQRQAQQLQAVANGDTGTWLRVLTQHSETSQARRLSDLACLMYP